MSAESAPPPLPESEYFRTFAPGEVIFLQGEDGDLMYVIEEGEVEIFHQSQPGAPEERLAVLQHGDFFGEMAVLEGEPRTASARAHTEARVLPVSGSTFAKILRNNPEISIRMMRKLCGRLRGVEERLRRLQVESKGARAQSDGPGTLWNQPVAPAPPPAPRTPSPSAAPPARTGRLVATESGVVHVLPEGADLTVGRPDRSAGTVPDVDLSELARDRSVSRRHARILRRDGKLFLYEEPGTANGTWLNGERVASATPAEFEVGDELGFGSVRLVYHED